jgi:hypothetical protein
MARKKIITAARKDKIKKVGKTVGKASVLAGLAALIQAFSSSDEKK